MAFSFGEAFIREGDEILVTEMEHHANIVPWQMLCERKGAVLKVLPFNDKADAEVIRAEFDLSKNAFKRAVGHLYKERKIEIRKDSIVLK